MTVWSTISFIVKFRLVLTFRVPSPPLSTATVEQGEWSGDFVSGADSGGSPLLRRPLRRRRSRGAGNRPPAVHIT